MMYDLFIVCKEPYWNSLFGCIGTAVVSTKQEGLKVALMLTQEAVIALAEKKFALAPLLHPYADRLLAVSKQFEFPEDPEEMIKMAVQQGVRVFTCEVWAGLPSIVSHILSNFYNQTRPEYYRQLDKARKARDLTHFIKYAVQGFRDGLRENLSLIQMNQFSIFWQYYIHKAFADLKYTKKTAFKRKRGVMLQLPVGKEYAVDEIIMLTPEIAKEYATVNRATVLRDLKELQELGLLGKKGKKYFANAAILKSMMPNKRLMNNNNHN